MEAGRNIFDYLFTGVGIFLAFQAVIDEDKLLLALAVVIIAITSYQLFQEYFFYPMKKLKKKYDYLEFKLNILGRIKNLENEVFKK